MATSSGLAPLGGQLHTVKPRTCVTPRLGLPARFHCGDVLLRVLDKLVSHDLDRGDSVAHRSHVRCHLDSVGDRASLFPHVFEGTVGSDLDRLVRRFAVERPGGLSDLVGPLGGAFGKGGERMQALCLLSHLLDVLAQRLLGGGHRLAGT